MTDFLKGKTLHERQIRYYNGSHCPYCDKETDYEDSEIVYQRSHGMIYICKPCRAWVGVHNSGTDQAFGFVAKQALRDLRHEAHKYFDPLWQHKIKLDGFKKKSAQAAARKWLAGYLGIDIVECHIGMFDEEQCKKTIEICKTFRLTPEQIAAKERAIQNNINIVEFLAGELGFDFKKNDLNGVIHISMIHPDGSFYNYRPKENIAAIPGKNEKWKPVEDIEKFIYEHFKQKEPCLK